MNRFIEKPDIFDGKREDLEQMALYLAGYAAGVKDEKIKEAAGMLLDASEHVCAQGYYGCSSGKRCTSDHK